MFGESKGGSDDHWLGDLHTGFYVLAAIVMIGLALLVLRRRYTRIAL
jgi:LPXTG-motif cell wall-anchored protein